MTQTAALPLGSWLKIDPWDDSIHMLDAKRYAPMNARDKMPFEVTPIFYKLQRYETAHATPPAAPAAATPAAAIPPHPHRQELRMRTRLPQGSRPQAINRQHPRHNPLPGMRTPDTTCDRNA